jgi:hypothetical protein
MQSQYTYSVVALRSCEVLSDVIQARDLPVLARFCLHLRVPSRALPFPHGWG